jgi:hypothetical protein
MIDYNLYILAIYGSSSDTVVSAGKLPPVDVYSVYEKKPFNTDTNILVPTITTDGRITFLLVGNTVDLNKIRQGIAMSFAKYLEQLCASGVKDISLGNFAVVGTALHLPEAPNIKCTIFKTLVFPKRLPELEQVYSALKGYCDVGGTVKEASTRLQIQSYFTQELPKKWINDVITGWKQMLNWNDTVDVAIKAMEQRKAKI